MKHIKHTLLIALFGMANFVAATDSFQPQIIKGRIIEKGTGMPVSNAILEIRYFIGDAVMGMQSATVYASSENGEFTITNLSDQVSSCDIGLMDRNKYQESSISGPFEPGINDWGTCEVSVRPFYFESCRRQANLVFATIVNTTGKKAYMRFWLTGRLTRLDDSEYLGCGSEFLLQLKQDKKGCGDYVTYQLIPGKNDVELRMKDYGPDISVSVGTISGGRSYSEPMMPTFAFHQMWPSPFHITNSLPVIINLPPISITNFPPVLTNFPPVITNLPPISITNFPPFITNLPPIRITNLPPYTIASVWTWGSPY